MTTPDGTSKAGEAAKPLEPHEKIELEMFRWALQDAPEPIGTDIAQLFSTATDLISGGGMSKDDALRGVVNCLVSRVVGYRAECLAHRKESEQWAEKWKAAITEATDYTAAKDAEIARLRERCGALEAASVRVVRMIDSHPQPLSARSAYPLDSKATAPVTALPIESKCPRVVLLPGQHLAIIERRSEAVTEAARASGVDLGGKGG